MGWAGGTDLGIDIYEKIRDYIPEEKRKEVAAYIYEYLCDLDADAWENDSQLEIDAEVPVLCDSCGEEYSRNELSEDRLCEVCEDEVW